jgi:hypothetical protein
MNCITNELLANSKSQNFVYEHILGLNCIGAKIDY